MANMDITQVMKAKRKVTVDPCIQTLSNSNAHFNDIHGYFEVH